MNGSIVSKKDIFALAGLIVLISSFFIYRTFRRNEIVQTKFSGIVRSIKYDDKSYPLVMINGKEYHLSFGREEIKVSDSLVKEKESYKVMQYRKGEFIDEFEWWNR